MSANNLADSEILLAVDTKLRNVTSSLSRKRWGEVEIEKGPVNLFPTELTDEVSMQEMELTFAFLKAKTTIFQGV